MNHAGGKSILFVCSGNTCRSPMAKVILEKLMAQAGAAGNYTIDSAAYLGPSGARANPYAREAILRRYGRDLLSSHQSKRLTQDLINKADLILVMEERMKHGLPPEKTYSLAEYAGESGDIPDPFGGTLTDDIKFAEELTRLLTSVDGQLN